VRNLSFSKKKTTQVETAPAKKEDGSEKDIEKVKE
jgi:hypothetical protein